MHYNMVMTYPKAYKPKTPKTPVVLFSVESVKLKLTVQDICKVSDFCGSIHSCEPSRKELYMRTSGPKVLHYNCTH
uniref:MSP domain-containing protein n=1 Tax=Steinernema glaseri TaxID=37863 RepID=A0A1I7ZSA9_9BILA